MDNLQNLLTSETTRREVWQSGQDKTYEVTKRRRNGIVPLACAGTMSVWLQRAGVFYPNQFYTWAQTLVNELEDKMGWQRIDEYDSVRPFDLVVTLDRNNNNATDHIFFALTRPDDNLTVKAVDNQNRGVPYRRNLRQGRNPFKTGMDYALRSPTRYPEPADKTRRGLVEVRDALRVIYSNEKIIPHEARVHLNRFSNNSFLDNVRND